VEVVSTPTENTILSGYLTKITILIAIYPCNIAAFYGHLFLAQVVRRFFGRNGLQMPLAALQIDHVGESGNWSVLRRTWGPPQLSPPTPPVRDPFFTSESSQPEKNRLASSGNGANTRQDYSLKSLFCQNIHFKANKTVQFSGLLRAPFFGVCYTGFSGETGCKCPWQPSKSITSENAETDRFIDGIVICIDLLAGQDHLERNFRNFLSHEKNISRKFLVRLKNIFRIFCEPPKFFGIILKNRKRKKNFPACLTKNTEAEKMGRNPIVSVNSSKSRQHSS
jgi:hypothetical protein